MPDNQGTKLAGRVGTLYRNHCGLFWRIVMPVAIIAISRTGSRCVTASQIFEPLRRWWY